MFNRYINCCVVLFFINKSISIVDIFKDSYSLGVVLYFGWFRCDKVSLFRFLRLFYFNFKS